MAPKIVTAHTQYADDKFVIHTLKPGDELPKGHEKFVKNPKVFADAPGAAPAAARSATSPASTKPLADLRKADLVALAKDRGIDHSGTADDIRVLIAKADADEAAADAEKAKSDPDADLSELDRAALEARAGEQRITEFDENTSDDELIALIENARG